MDTKPVLVLITADNCGFCKQLKQQWANIKREILNLNVRVVEINLPTMSTRIDSNLYPKDLQNYQGWYPMLLLISGNIWNVAMVNKNNTKLDAQVMNGEWVDGTSLRPVQIHRNDKEGITAWISDALSKVNNATLISIHGNRNENKTVLTPQGKGNVCRLNIKPKRAI